MPPRLSEWTRSPNQGLHPDNCPTQLWNAYLAVESLEEELRLRQNTRQNAVEIPDILYHYTDLLGLVGMFSDFNLRLSDASYMNDPSEGVWVYELANEIALQHLGSSSMAQKLISLLEAHRNTPDSWDIRLRDDKVDDIFFMRLFTILRHPGL